MHVNAHIHTLTHPPTHTSKQASIQTHISTPSTGCPIPSPALLGLDVSDFNCTQAIPDPLSQNYLIPYNYTCRFGCRNTSVENITSSFTFKCNEVGGSLSLTSSGNGTLCIGSMSVEWIPFGLRVFDLPPPSIWPGFAQNRRAFEVGFRFPSKRADFTCTIFRQKRRFAGPIISFHY